MARVGAPYLPIRPAGHKPAPVPYFHELMKAQNMLPIGITALAASAGDDDKKKEDEEKPKEDPEGDWVVLDPEGREWSRWGTEEEAEADRQRWETDPEDLLGYSVKNVKEKADYSFDLPERQQQIIDELREKMGDQEADALEEKIRLGIKSETKHAQGGLVGINHLTRRL